jgi:methyl-accepting chemotaxis protein
MFSDLSISKRMLIACSVVVLLFSTTFAAVGVSLTHLSEEIHRQAQVSARSGQEHATGWTTEEAFQEILGAIESSITMMMIGGVVSASMAAIFGIWIVLGIRRQLGGEPAYAAYIVSRVAEGDLTVKPQVRASDNTSLIFSVRNMVENLIRLCMDVRANSDNVNLSSSEIAASNVDMARRSEEQAETLADAEAGMDELRSAVQRNTESTRLAYQLAQGANEIAEQSGNAVEMLVGTMGGINSSSKKIGDIVGVIDGIAFQTNILALNAAVEAARAGEQGRGFAVVAGEVRNLAQRSAAAAREIKSLISESVNKVSAGTIQVKEAADGISDVVTSVHLVSSQMKEISDSTAKQGDSIVLVNQAMAKMADVIRQNSVLVGQAGAAAGAMQHQAEALRAAVSMFRLDVGTMEQLKIGRASDRLPLTV